MYRLTVEENNLVDVRPDAGETATGRYYVADYTNVFPVVTGSSVLGYQSATINWLSALNGIAFKASISIAGVLSSVLF
eukprot:CAMPEP_0116881058 /NCGR_PEP_ID=MMETSP0463-20121206/13122_1 /TAXON_ID=181622 /ORGANISM="Strombidinopsis sp, Strain SopsisLIS2011" /LENGTH=77 /DNA_ID=CAMNT_0004532527 /DNA_START=525 /DNA_END=758 /DNA_ORIENTATION=-